MKKKIVSIFVCMLMFATVFTVAGATNSNEIYYLQPTPKSTDIFWEDNFDSYTLGPLHGQGGWEAWDGNSDTTGYVTDDQSHSPSNSAEIAWFNGFAADMVYQFSGVSSGIWTLSVWQYVPSDMVGISYFLLLNTYSHGGPYSWSCQVDVSATRGTIEDYDNPDDSLPLITDEWVEIVVEIDFESDIQTVYYNGDELLSKSWVDGSSGGGAKNFACIDLYADQIESTSVYYDDFVLEGEAAADPDLECSGSLSWVNASPGSTLTGSFTVENVGGAGSELDWEIVDTPSWGDWTFDPESGMDLTPEDGAITIDVTCVAPNEKNQEFIGKIKIENLENSEDFCYIDISLTTPLSKPVFVLQILERLLQIFPILEMIFNNVF